MTEHGMIVVEDPQAAYGFRKRYVNPRAVVYIEERPERPWLGVYGTGCTVGFERGALDFPINAAEFAQRWYAAMTEHHDKGRALEQRGASSEAGE